MLLGRNFILAIKGKLSDNYLYYYVPSRKGCNKVLLHTAIKKNK